MYWENWKLVFISPTCRQLRVERVRKTGPPLYNHGASWARDTRCLRALRPRRVLPPGAPGAADRAGCLLYPSLTTDDGVHPTHESRHAFPGVYFCPVIRFTHLITFFGFKKYTVDPWTTCVYTVWAHRGFFSIYWKKFLRFVTIWKNSQEKPYSLETWKKLRKS